MALSLRTSHSALRTGFTLIELLLVLTILAILAGLVLPRFTGTTEKGRRTAAITQIDSFKTALNLFEQSCGRFPSSEEGLQALITQPGNAKGWAGPYIPDISTIPKDPWDNDYVYRCPPQHGTSYDLSSNGPDGQPDTDDDITSWQK